MKNYFKILKLLFIPLLFMLFMNSFFIINEFEQAIVLQFGKPVGDSKTVSGLYFKLPFLQNVVKFEKRILEWDGDPTEIQTKVMIDKTYVVKVVWNNF